jgi:hypothetical protein
MTCEVVMVISLSCTLVLRQRWSVEIVELATAEQDRASGRAEQRL